jgi:hypothetical protein
VWDDDLHGNYNVKSGYNLLLNSTVQAAIRIESADWKWLWKIHAPPKAKHLLFVYKCHWFVLFVKMMRKVIGIFSLSVKTVRENGKLQA